MAAILLFRIPLNKDLFTIFVLMQGVPQTMRMSRKERSRTMEKLEFVMAAFKGDNNIAELCGRSWISPQTGERSARHRKKEGGQGLIDPRSRSCSRTSERARRTTLLRNSPKTSRPSLCPFRSPSAHHNGVSFPSHPQAPMAASISSLTKTSSASSRQS